MAAHLHGPLLAFWVFHINRSYGAALRKAGARLADNLPRLMALNDTLERRIGKVDVLFCHNDLLAANIFDDGARLWLLDWDYAGFNSPLFDLANLSSNNGFFPAEDAALLDGIFRRPARYSTTGRLPRLQCDSLLREILWSAVFELTSQVGFDYPASTNDYLAQLDVAVADSVEIPGNRSISNPWQLRRPGHRHDPGRRVHEPPKPTLGAILIRLAAFGPSSASRA